MESRRDSTTIPPGRLNRKLSISVDQLPKIDKLASENNQIQSKSLDQLNRDQKIDNDDVILINQDDVIDQNQQRRRSSH
uniref:Uncharacterized protein n=1 Tax=Romanomermis culicivorax TaxID=13658 RepID=A0A915LAK9_ROMCU